MEIIFSNGIILELQFFINMKDLCGIQKLIKLKQLHVINIPKIKKILCELSIQYYFMKYWIFWTIEVVHIPSPSNSIWKKKHYFWAVREVELFILMNFVENIRNIHIIYLSQSCQVDKFHGKFENFLIWKGKGTSSFRFFIIMRFLSNWLFLKRNSFFQFTNRNEVIIGHFLLFMRMFKNL